MGEAETYGLLDRAWKSTSKVIFGEPLGELNDYGDWLGQLQGKMRREISSVSGKPIYLAVNEYCSGAKFISFEEADFSRKFQPLGINEIKDIDSIAESLRERFFYAGNIVLGNSHYVEESSNVTDSAYVYRSTIVADSKYIAYSTNVRQNEYTFGTYGDGLSSYVIGGGRGHENRRCFECFGSPSTTDSYYCTDCFGCTDCMFCFGARSISHAIGNLELPKTKYDSLKSKLVSEIRGQLQRDKRIFSLLDVISNSREYAPELSMAAKEEDEGSAQIAEKAFSRTSSLLLGKELSGMGNYAEYLKRHVIQNGASRSQISGCRALVGGFFVPLQNFRNMGGRVVRPDEMLLVGRKSIKLEEAEKLRADSSVLASFLHPIAYMSLDLQLGTKINVVDSADVVNSENCCHGSVYAGSKKCAYCFWPRNSEHIFGSSAVFESSFCLKCHYSKKLSRCFECDSCESSSGLYFSHNCENVNDGMFCFNVKNLRNAIGNAAYEPAEYRQLKSGLLGQISGDLERKKDLKWDIYNLGCASSVR